MMDLQKIAKLYSILKEFAVYIPVLPTVGQIAFTVNGMKVSQCAIDRIEDLDFDVYQEYDKENGRWVTDIYGRTIPEDV